MIYMIFKFYVVYGVGVLESVYFILNLMMGVDFLFEKLIVMVSDYEKYIGNGMIINVVMILLVVIVLFDLGFGVWVNIKKYDGEFNII